MAEARHAVEGTVRQIAVDTVTVPRVESMRDYILRRHRGLILQGLEAWARREGGAFALAAEDCRITGMSFWRYDTHTLLAEALVSIRLPGNEGAAVCPAYCEIWVDMQDRMTFTLGECGYLTARPQRRCWPMSEYLVPILRREEIEAGAEALLHRYCPEAFYQQKGLHAQTLARRMGLEVMWLPLHQRSRTRSILFFRPGRVLTAETGADGIPSALPRAVTIPGNTIVINLNAVHRDQCQLEIFHECIHYDWHFMFFRLQAMHHSDLRALRRRRRTVMTRQNAEHPLTWMEWQARRGSFGLMMPQSLLRPMITRLAARLQGSPLHAGRRFDWIARSIAAAQGWPRFRVRARLIQLGHVEARGALNYVDGAYIEPFAFNREKGEGACSFVIDRRSVLALYAGDSDFRRLIRSGRYVYADGHICLGGEEYIRQGPAGLKLTTWANAHVDQCCMRFLQKYEPCDPADYCFGQMHSDEEYNRQYLEFAANGADETRLEQMAEMARLLESLPASFPAALTFLMRRAHVTIEQLEEKAFISARTISRLRTEERGEYALDQVIAICIALHLPPWLSRELLQRAGFILRRTKQQLAYQCVLDCMFMDEVSDVQRFLAESGFARLKLNEG